MPDRTNSFWIPAESARALSAEEVGGRLDQLFRIAPYQVRSLGIIGSRRQMSSVSPR
jgi:hypothetical protein